MHRLKGRLHLCLKAVRKASPKSAAHVGALPARKAAAARLVPLAGAQDGLSVRVVPEKG